jgi:DNA polymerase
MIPAFAKTDPGMQELLEHPEEEIRFLAEARLAVKSTLVESRSLRYLKCSTRGPMTVYTKYSGAHTRRRSGGDKTNYQNMGRDDVKRPEMILLKRSIEAPEGHMIVAADSAQIQARINAWLCNHWELVEAFAQGRDVYSEFASKIYMREINRKKNKEDFIPGFVGKTCTLGLGFQMWWPKFAFEMLKGALGGPPVQFTADDINNGHQPG